VLPCWFAVVVARAAVDSSFDGQPRDGIGENAPARILLVVEVKLTLTGQQQTAQFTSERPQVAGFGDGHGDQIGRAAAGLIGKSMHGHSRCIIAVDPRHPIEIGGR